MPTASPSLLHSLLTVLCLLSFAFPLHAQTQPQTQPPPPKFNAAGITTAAQLQQKISAAKRPKSDKWPLSLPPIDPKKYQQIDYIIVTDLTDAGRALPEPEFDKPVYYTWSGTHDNEYKNFLKQLTNALASNSYRPSDENHPPTQVISYAWGTQSRMETAGNTDNSGDADVSVNSDDIIALLSRAKTVGGEKFANEFARALASQLEWLGTSNSSQNGPLRRFAEHDETTRYTDTKAVVHALFNDWNYLLVYSLDFEAFRNNQNKPLWITRILTSAQDTSSERTQAIMVNNGAYFFGRETDAPVILRKRTYRIDLPINGPNVVEYITYITGTTSTTSSSTTTPATSGTATHDQ